MYLSETRAYRGFISVDYCVLKNLFLQWCRQVHCSFLSASICTIVYSLVVYWCIRIDATALTRLHTYFFIYISYVLPQCVLIKFDGKPYSNTEETFVMLLVELDGMPQSWTLTAALLDKSYGDPTHVFGTCFLFGRSHFLGIDLLRFFWVLYPFLLELRHRGLFWSVLATQPAVSSTWPFVCLFPCPWLEFWFSKVM